MGKLQLGLKRSLALAIVLGMGATMGGCAGDNGDLNRVQPGYVKKSDMLGTSWYYRRTVVDSSEATAWATIGTGDLFTVERIRWEIQEDHLIAYRDYEYIPNAEDGKFPDAKYEGAPLAAFPITEHFDVMREYNPSTGEQTNVISANTRDRTWYEREYMRVDWSKNDNPTLNQIIPVYVNNSPGDSGLYYVHENDATNPYHARIQPENGYIDIVTDHVVHPDMETCYLNLNQENCTYGEIKVRHAFVQRDETLEQGYKPLWYPDSVTLKDSNGKEIMDPATGEVMREPIYQRFGFYRIEKPTFDEQRDLTESGRLDRAMRFHIWDASVDAQGNDIPVANRKVRPINYYLNWDFPADLRTAAQAVADEWNAALKQTVASLWNKPVSQVPDVFVLHDNSCSVAGLKAYFGAHADVSKNVATTMGVSLNADTLDTLPADQIDNWCSATEYHSRGLAVDQRFVWQQNGDPRFNMLFYITNITPSGFAGYGPMLSDPLTGRIVQSSAYIMGWTIDASATRAFEYVKYLNGEITVSQLIEGANLPVGYRANEADPYKTTRSLDDTQARALTAVSDDHLRSLDQRFARYGQSTPELLKPIDNKDYFTQRLARVQGTSLEKDYLLRPEDLMVASHGQWKPGMPETDELRAAASFINRQKKVRDLLPQQQRFLQEKTFCPVAELDGTLIGLAKQLKPLSDAERMQKLREAIFKAVSLHEVGHNLGLRHNFEGSFDALNYHDTFWDIEAAGLTEDAKQDARQSEYKYSSIMDYHGRVNADFQGLGKYDRAAIKFGYGQLVENFTAANASGGKNLSNWIFVNDYRRIPDYLGHGDKMFSRTDVPFDWTKNNLTPDDVKRVTTNEVPYMYCSDEYAGRTPTCNRFDFGANMREIFQADYVRYKNYFLFTNYLRNRLNVNWAATDRGYSVFRNVITTYQYMYLYRSRQASMFGGTSFFDTDLGRDMATAVSDGLNMMSEVLATPEPGIHHSCTDQVNGVNVFVHEDSISGGLGPNFEVCNMTDQGKQIIDVGDAQPLFLDFNEDYVNWTFNYLGTYWDKMAALAELSDPMAVYYRVNGQEDRRLYSVSPYRIYDREILDIFSKLIQYDRSDIGSFVEQSTGRVVPRSLVDGSVALGTPRLPGAPSAGSSTPMPVVMPALARNLQRTALLYAAAWLSSPLDDTLDFTKHTRVALKGGQDDIAAFDHPTPDLKVSECAIPGVGQTFRAMQSRDGYSIGYDMVHDCASLAGQLVLSQDALRSAQAALDAAQHLVDTTPTTAANYAQLKKDRDQANTHLNDVSDQRNHTQSRLATLQQMLQYTRLIHLVYEHGAEL